jgi:hypothetical protein
MHVEEPQREINPLHIARVNQIIVLAKKSVNKKISAARLTFLNLSQ